MNFHRAIAVDHYGMTRKQVELLSFIRTYWAEHKCPPSFDEMKDGLDLRSKSGIHRLLNALEERGKIRRLPNRARSIEVLPDEAALTLRLPDEIEERLFARAAERGETVEHTTIKIIRDALFQA